MSRFNSRTPGGVRQPCCVVAVVKTSVSIHAPREGCDLLLLLVLPLLISFNSRTPGGVRLKRRRTIINAINVSIHAPREGCDLPALFRPNSSVLFQFTHPGRGATIYNLIYFAAKISFNSRTPGGVRQSTQIFTSVTTMFQFTHPGRGATVWCKVAYYGADKQA